MLSTVMLALIRPNPSAGQAWLARLGAAMRQRLPTALTPAYGDVVRLSLHAPYTRPVGSTMNGAIMPGVGLRCVSNRL